MNSFRRVAMLAAAIACFSSVIAYATPPPAQSPYQEYFGVVAQSANASLINAKTDGPSHTNVISKNCATLGPARSLGQDRLADLLIRLGGPLHPALLMGGSYAIIRSHAATYYIRS